MSLHTNNALPCKNWILVLCVMRTMVFKIFECTIRYMLFDSFKLHNTCMRAKSISEYIAWGLTTINEFVCHFPCKHRKHLLLNWIFTTSHLPKSQFWQISSQSNDREDKVNIIIKTRIIKLKLLLGCRIKENKTY